jgi:hypothetical protein
MVAATIDTPQHIIVFIFLLFIFVRDAQGICESLAGIETTGSNAVKLNYCFMKTGWAELTRSGFPRWAVSRRNPK